MNNRIEIREAEPGGPIELSGHAATFDDPYEVGSFTETIRPGSFKRTLGENPDVSLLVNHAGTPLARTSSGTMTLREDGLGLAFTAELEPSDPDVQAIVPKLKRGDLSEMSFAFRASKQTWSEDKSQRVLHEVAIHRGDLSLVTTAANPSATASLRAEGLTLEQRKRIAERVGNRVCGPYSAPDAYRPTGELRPPAPPIRSYIETAKAKRAKLRRHRSEPTVSVERARLARVAAGRRAHPGSDASVDGEEDAPRCTEAQIAELGRQGRAFKKRDGTFSWPLADRRDLLNAIQDFKLGRAAQSEAGAVKAFIKVRARLLRLEELLPAEWQSKAKPQLHPKEIARVGREP
jgi:uncharacterized protein